MPFLGVNFGKRPKSEPYLLDLFCFFALTPKYRCIPLKKIKPDFREYIKSAKTSNFVKTPFF